MGAAGYPYPGRREAPSHPSRVESFVLFFRAYMNLASVGGGGPADPRHDAGPHSHLLRPDRIPVHVHVALLLPRPGLRLLWSPPARAIPLRARFREVAGPGLVAPARLAAPPADRGLPPSRGRVPQHARRLACRYCRPLPLRSGRRTGTTSCSCSRPSATFLAAGRCCSPTWGCSCRAESAFVIMADEGVPAGPAGLERPGAHRSRWRARGAPKTTNSSGFGRADADQISSSTALISSGQTVVASA